MCSNEEPTQPKINKKPNGKAQVLKDAPLHLSPKKFQALQELCARNRQEDQIYISYLNHSITMGKREKTHLLKTLEETRENDL